MCEFVSWVVKQGKVRFLTGEIIQSEKFREIARQRGISPDDYNGHGSIRAYYGIDEGDGVNREYTDFASPNNFPLQIEQAIREGRMRGLGVAEHLLLPGVYAKWRAERDAVDAKRQSERDTVYAKFWPERSASYSNYSKWRAERDVIDAKWQPEWDTVYAKFWDLFANPVNRVEVWR